MSTILTACLDANIYISAIAFGGKPLKILERALTRDFILVTSPIILEEAKRNLIGKLEVTPFRVNTLMNDLLEVASVFVPTGKLNITSHLPDNLVLETAWIGGAEVLVTGDKKHLLGLFSYKGVTIETPAKFLERLG